MPIRAAVRDVQDPCSSRWSWSSLVIFVFLRSVSATIIPSLALPMSIVGTFAFMYAFGYSLDNLSLMALTLCVGFVVDDAIVMLENITRHMEMGKSRMQATLDGSKEIGFTIVSMTLSLVAVFIPVMFMGGILGRLLREFAVDDHRRRAHLRRRFAHAHADAVQPHAGRRASQEARPHLRLQRAHVRWDASGLPSAARLGAASISAMMLAVFGDHHWSARRVLFMTMSKGFLPDRRFRPAPACSRRLPQDVSFDAMAAMQGQVADDRQGKSKRARRDVVDRQRAAERVAERRAGYS